MRQIQRKRSNPTSSIFPRKYIDWPLLTSLMILSALGLLMLYSASHGNYSRVIRQIIHLAISFFGLLSLAYIKPDSYRFWTPWFFVFSLLLLSSVLLKGEMGKGAQRWLHLGIFQFQPSELMKLLVPMILAWYLHDRLLPPTLLESVVLVSLTLLPVFWVAKQPDLGTALLIAASGGSVLLLAGIRKRIIISTLLLLFIFIPIIWYNLHDYQRYRVITFIHPERDPLGLGYHIIQSKIAIGSGGLLGKGWLQGTQSHLQFLPEDATDFIFAVFCEEWGLIGAATLVSLYLWIALRGLGIGLQAQDTFSRLLAGTFSLNFFLAVFVNIGMVSGILPVVGIPLPFVSYGGTSLVTWAASFGMLMSIKHHRKLLSS